MALNGPIGTAEVIALANAISARIVEVHVNAAHATFDAAAAHVVATAAAVDETSRAECVRRNDELAESITRAGALKTTALEREAVVVDALLIRMQEPLADIAAMQAELHGTFGNLPLTPVEPSALFVVFAADTGVAVLCSARGLGAECVAASPPPGAWLASDSARMCFALQGDQPPHSCPAELRATLLALASRVRVAAALVPLEGAAPVGPVPLAAECGLNDAGDGICVTFAVPDARPPGAAAWLLRATRIDLGGSPLPLGTLAAGARVLFRHRHSATCNHVSAPTTAAEVYDGAWYGDVPRIIRALADGGSTCEKNGVRITRGQL